MPLTALVSGYSGFVGRELLKQMSAGGWHFVLVGRKPPAGQLKYQHVYADFEDDGQFPRHIPPPDAIIHLASKVSTRAESDRDLYAANCLSTALLTDWAIKWNCSIVLASSISVYGAGLAQITPNDLPRPESAYGRSKLLAEQIIEGGAVDHCILRLPGIFGGNGPRHLGMNNAIETARGGDIPVLEGSGDALRNYIYVKDAAAAIGEAVSKRLTGTHLVAGREILSIADMLRLICDRWLPGRTPHRIEGEGGRNSIVTGEYPFRLSYSFDEALRDIAETS